MRVCKSLFVNKENFKVVVPVNRVYQQKQSFKGVMSTACHKVQQEDTWNKSFTMIYFICKEKGRL